MQLSRYLADLEAQDRLATRNRIAFSVLQSTNSFARCLAAAYLEREEEPPQVLVTALEQTQGRGRLGRSWSSPPGGVYASLVVAVPSWPYLAALPVRVAVGLCRELDPFVTPSCLLKWPNDLMVEGRKIGGILIESVVRGDAVAAVVGFGVNYSADLDGVAAGATSVLRAASSPVPPLGALTALLVSAVERALSPSVASGDAMREFSRRSVHRPGDRLRCRTAAAVYEGLFAGFDEHGFLRLITPAGERSISAGELIERPTGGTA